MDAAGNYLWSRPTTVPFPKLYRKHVGKKPLANGLVPKFKVQDVPENLHEEVLDFMTNFFLRDECMCASLKFLEDKDSVNELRRFWKKSLNRNVVIVALLDDGNVDSRPQIAGVNMTNVCSKSQTFTYDYFKSKVLRKFAKFGYQKSLESVNVFERYGVDHYLSAIGLCVHPDFRGQGLCSEIIKARYDLCKTVGLKASVSIYSTKLTQKRALEANMEFLTEIVYEDCKEDGENAFPNITEKSMILMGIAVV